MQQNRDVTGQRSAPACRAAQAIPNARLIEFPELGHAPQIEAPEAFHKALLGALADGRQPN